MAMTEQLTFPDLDAELSALARNLASAHAELTGADSIETDAINERIMQLSLEAEAIVGKENLDAWLDQACPGLRWSPPPEAPDSHVKVRTPAPESERDARALAETDSTVLEGASMGRFDPAAVAKEIMQHLAEVESAEMSLISNKRRAAELLQDVAKNHPTRLKEVCALAGIGASRRKELLQIALGRRTPEQIKCSTKERVKRHRDARRAREPARPLQPPVTASGNDVDPEASAAGCKTEDVATEHKAVHVPPAKPAVSAADHNLAQFRIACDTWLPRLPTSMHAAAHEYVREVLLKAAVARATNDEAA
jgi:hypothetical protein